MTRYRIRTRVVNVVRKDQLVSVSKDGNKITENLGWFVLFENSYEYISFGFEKPELVNGQGVTITIEGDQDAGNV